MNIDDLSESKFLTKKDCGRGILVTITEIRMQNVARQNEPAENKAIVYFAEAEKGLACNKINREVIASIVGSRDTDHWRGHKVVLYDDPNIIYGGKVTGGIRVRAPRPQPGVASAPQQFQQHTPAAAPMQQPRTRPVPPPDEDDNIAF